MIFSKSSTPCMSVGSDILFLYIHPKQKPKTMHYKNVDSIESLTDREIAELTLATNLIILRKIDQVLKNKIHNTYADEFKDAIDYLNQINTDIKQNKGTDI